MISTKILGSVSLVLAICLVGLYIWHRGEAAIWKDERQRMNIYIGQLEKQNARNEADLEDKKRQIIEITAARDAAVADGKRREAIVEARLKSATGELSKIRKETENVAPGDDRPVSPIGLRVLGHLRAAHPARPPP